MPIKVADGLPAIQTLESEHIFVMTENRAVHQDIRPLKIIILNLMPKKVETETQLLRLLGNSPLQVECDFLQTVTHVSKNTSSEHLLKFYSTFDEVRDGRYDGMIITGAPVELLDFEQVDYWPELCEIMDWSRRHVYSTLHICWGAQAGLYRHFGVPKFELPQKLTGVFPHRPLIHNHPLLRGFDDRFYMPHSRYTGTRKEDVLNVPGLSLLAESDEAGVCIAASDDGRLAFVTGHMEYDRETLKDEYLRDRDKGEPSPLPRHYFPWDNPDARPVMMWRSHAELFFGNWLNYCVYQSTPYDLGEL